MLQFVGDGSFDEQFIKRGNELGRHAFLERRLGFLEIAAIVETVLDRLGTQAADSIEAVMALDGVARAAAEDHVAMKAAS